MELDYSTGIKPPHRDHHYILQNILTWNAVYVLFYTIQHSCPFVGTHTQLQHATTACRRR